MNSYTLVFTNQELNTIFGALQELPFKNAAPVIESIRMQIQAAQEEQRKKDEQAEEEKEKIAHEMDHMFNGDKEGDKE